MFKVAHLNTQSMLSTFDTFEVLLNHYPLDVITLSETWLNDNKHVLDHVRIPGYTIHYRNRNDRRGGGVGIYINENIKSKLRNDLINFEPNLEHQWFELQGKNKHSHVLIGNFYQLNFQTSKVHAWLDKFDALLNRVTSVWQGIIIITGDMNIDLLTSTPTTQRYTDNLSCYNLHQQINDPTRNSTSLIDHISITHPNKVQLSGVIPCPEVSDHGMPFTYLISPLTHIINSSIKNNTFPAQWKIGKISPIPKIDSPEKEDDFRPIVDSRYLEYSISRTFWYLEQIGWSLGHFAIITTPTISIQISIVFRKQ